MAHADTDLWPELPGAAWKDTRATLHLWTQIVGKLCLATMPWLNHSWHISLRLTARGLATPLMPVGARHLQIEFDFVGHILWLRLSDGQLRQIMLTAMPVAEFYAAVLRALSELGVTIRIDNVPNEVPDAIAFDQDRAHCSYDPDFVNRFWRILLRSHDVFSYFRTSFLGKASPVHFFWGSFDLAVTRFSGRRAPQHPGGVPHLPDAVVREAYSHQVSSAGFWPGGGVIDYPAFYSYAYPAPDGFALASVRPPQAFFSAELSEFILPYDTVRTAPRPASTLLDFLESTYSAAAEAGKWDRAALECGLGEVGRPRQV